MNLAQARELAVLSVLHAHPAHGYDIARMLGSGPLSLLGLSRPAIYAILDRFKKRGWAVGAQEQSENFPVKTVMVLTPEGREAFAEMTAATDTAPDAPVLPLMALVLAHDAGQRIPSQTISAMIADRQARLDALKSDKEHAGAATRALAISVIESELATLASLPDS